MKTFYEEILNIGIKKEWDLLPFLMTTEVIFIQNIFDLVMEQKKEFFSLKEIPNAAPPLENMWFEYKANIDGEDLLREVGFLFVSQRNDEFMNRWVIRVFWYLKNNGHILLSPDKPYLSMATYSIDGSGQFNPIDIEHNFLFDIANILNESAFRKIKSVYQANVYIPFLAISFMHCKNVELIKRGKGTQQKARDRHGSKITYKVLEITPMKKVLKTEGDIEHVGIKKALHICRGHFKDYRERGLFGKYQGLFWWDSHVRGDADAGIVDKDYSINPKKE